MTTINRLNKLIEYAWSVPLLGQLINRIAVNNLANSNPPRPRPYSLWSAKEKPDISDYTAWPSLTDRDFSGRHLPPAPQSYTDSLPPDKPYKPQEIGEITALFQRKNGVMIKDRSSVLFMFFAQWFTDSVLRVDSDDRRKNTSNHEIDLCQIYGLEETTTNILRSHQGGKLRSQIIDGEEYLDYLYEQDAEGKLVVKKCYTDLPFISKIDGILEIFPENTREDRKKKLYATGLERGNASIGYVAISTLFMREHNRICKELYKYNPNWDDERLFQTARLINITLLLKFILQDYINHISGAKVFRMDTSFAERDKWYRNSWLEAILHTLQKSIITHWSATALQRWYLSNWVEYKRWYRTNWIAIEFNLLYRWHGLVPDVFVVNDRVYSGNEFRSNNQILEDVGIGTVLKAASQQAAGKIGLFNNPDFLLGAEYQTIKMSRDFRLRPYNEYRAQFGLPKFSKFSEITKNVQIQNELKRLYDNDIDRVEFLIGLFAEDPTGNGLFGSLLQTMVASDAFTQALTNPLLSQNIFNENTFTEYGYDLIKETISLQDFVDRNIKPDPSVKVAFQVN
ncbi:hypothetical protein C7H19_02055 [Aphanothece hegewaldii CCALA 016]|uniref:Heme peroxidase n=1 Tax=Aphanothece hegewaldii CCALA 016 TaxID=2107694 RepID=A0A2T1M290_9CHRO|nr:peroxidase family protein [Aphanothece hegewaldii]PSF38863.1 hypothetical protein C7H19_02055 [Aphanothece hegewaldii CCALA 016]